MTIFDKVGGFFTREIPRFVTKTIPNAVNSIPNPGDRAIWEPELPALRKRDKQESKRLATVRGQFYESKAALAQAQAEYRAVVEDYDMRLGEDAANRRFGRIRDAQWNDPASDAQIILDGIGNTVRDAVGMVSFDVTEVFFAPGEAKKERDFLKRRIARFGKMIDQMSQAIKQMNAARGTMVGEVEALRAELVSRGIGTDEASVSRARLENAAHAARVETAARMWADGVPEVQIGLATGLEPDEIEALASSAVRSNP